MSPGPKGKNSKQNLIPTYRLSNLTELQRSICRYAKQALVMAIKNFKNTSRFFGLVSPFKKDLINLFLIN